jgi:hypothetical protein
MARMLRDSPRSVKVDDVLVQNDLFFVLEREILSEKLGKFLFLRI